MVLDHEFPPDIRVENEAVSLIKSGHQVHLACYTRKSLPREDFYKGIIIHRIPISSFIYKASVAALTFPVYFKFWTRYIDRLIKEFDIEALHIHDLPLAEAGAVLKKRHNIKLVMDLHENWPALLRVSSHTNTVAGRLLSPNFLWIRYERKILRAADMIIVVVEEAADRIEKLGIDPSRIIIASNTLNVKGFYVPESKPDPEYFTLFYAGGITYHRGLQTVVNALSEITVKIPAIRFLIAGSGRYMPILKNIVSLKGLDNEVRFLGYMPLKDIAVNLSRSDAAVIPHLKTCHTDTTVPHKLFQYMYANKPIIASNCKPLERIINETGSGVIFKSGSSQDFARKILEVFDGSIPLNPARKWILGKYNWDVDAQTLVSMYEQLESETGNGQT